MNLVLTGIIGALTLVIAVLALYLRSYASSYASKKGENLATHEDIQKLIDQVRAVTQTAKEIEAKISDDVWARQRKRELKKEIILNALTRLGKARFAVLKFSSIYEAKIDALAERPEAADEMFFPLESEAQDVCSDATHQLEELLIQVEVVCDGDAVMEFQRISKLIRTLFYRVLDKAEVSAIKDVDAKIKEGMPRLIAAVRTELEINESPRGA